MTANNQQLFANRRQGLRSFIGLSERVAVLEISPTAVALQRSALFCDALVIT